MDHGRTHFGDEPARESEPHDETIAGDEDEVDRRRRLYAPGTTVGRYVLLQEVGAGAMGVVFAAFDPELNRKIALKILHPSRRAGAKAAAAARARLLREAQAIARVSHPHVISVYDVGTVHDAVFLAMEFVEGTTLTQWLEQPRSIPEIVDVFVQAARGLAAAHHAGLIHRDFKPDNVLVGFEAGGGETPRPQVRVSDFGLARNDPSVVRDDDSEDFLEVVPRGSLSDSDILSSPLTQVGAVVGTPRYMAPEQHFGNDGDPRSDQFGFSVALYIALYKQDPFSAPSLERLALAKQQGRIRRIPPDSRVPAFLEEAVMRGLSSSMDRRFRSMDEMVEALLQDPDARRRKMLVWGGGVALVGAVAATFGYVQAQGRERPCAGAEERLAGLWDDAQRERLRAALTGTGVGYADQVWVEVERQLDAYAVEWVAVHEEACEATHVRREQSDTLLDRRMSCLAGRRSALRALVEVLAAPDATVVQRAVQSAGALPSLEACSNTEVLLAQVEPPADEATAGAVAVVRDQLADARALEGAGKYGDALAVARQAGETAEQLGYPPLVAEALCDVGSALEATGDYPGAEDHLMRAVWEAIRAGHDEAVAKAATMLVGVVGDRRARHEEGLRWGEHARAVLDRLGLDPLAHARLDGALGNVLHRMNRQEEARKHFERAIAIRIEAKGADHPSLASLHLNLGNVHYRQRRYDEAVASYERARDLAATRMGREHPLVGAGVASLGLVFMALEEYEKAEQSYEAAMGIFRSAMGDDHPFVANTISNLGVVLTRLERHEEAREKYEEALAMYRASVGERHPDVARMLHNIGNVHQKLGELDEARRYYEQALEIRRESLPAHHTELGHSHEGLAELDELSGNLAAAVDGYTRALAIYEGGETDAITRARARFELAQALWEHGEHEPARTAGQTARDEIAGDDAAARKLRDEVEDWLRDR
jgi:eukaryotic-like serine/threonine-protein kinase